MVGDSGRHAPQMERIDRSSPSKKQLAGSLMIDAQNPSGYGNYLMIVHIYIYITCIYIYLYIYIYISIRTIPNLYMHFPIMFQASLTISTAGCLSILSSPGPPGSPCELPPEVQEIRGFGVRIYCPKCSPGWRRSTVK